MVSSNKGYPDPDNPSEDHLTSPNHEIVMVADTDTEDEENPYNDYVPLPMNETDVPEDSEDTTDENSTEEAAPPDDGLPPIATVEEEVVKDVWSSCSTSKDIEMDSTKVDEVKQAMLNFTLPPSSIPEWANNIPEEQWKEQLMNRLQNIQK